MADTTYMIAILRSVYSPDLQGLGQVGFINTENDQEIQYYDTKEEAKEVIEKLENESYCTCNGEAGRPEYYIVDDNVGDYIASGRNYDGSNYNWDNCDCDKMDGDCCGECSDCYASMIDEDRQYIIANAVE